MSVLSFLHQYYEVGIACVAMHRWTCRFRECRCGEQLDSTGRSVQRVSNALRPSVLRGGKIFCPDSYPRYFRLIANTEGVDLSAKPLTMSPVPACFVSRQPSTRPSLHPAASPTSPSPNHHRFMVGLSPRLPILHHALTDNINVYSGWTSDEGYWGALQFPIRARQTHLLAAGRQRTTICKSRASRGGHLFFHLRHKYHYLMLIIIVAGMMSLSREVCPCCCHPY